MFTSRRYAPLFLAAFTTFVFFLLFQTTGLHDSLQHVPQAVGLGAVDESAEEKSTTPEETATDTTTKERPPEYANPNPLFVPGTAKPVGYEYSKTVVIPRLARENTSWIEEQLGDILHPNGPLRTAQYVVDDSHAELHPPKNKGHEVMVYLSYIIDHYDDLPDVAMFMHSHRYAWHNNDVLDYDAATMIRYLSAERVTREGYMNLRCHWDPGCPEWLHPGALEKNYEKQEETLIAESWSELFPFDPIPSVLSQPCCAQFALSKERMLALPLSRYIFYRDWLLRTPLSDYLSGRVWEYLWQYIFTGHNVECPAMHACYCDGYGLCFGGPDQFQGWFDMRYSLREIENELSDWRMKNDAIEAAKEAGTLDESSMLEIPELGRDEVLIAQTDALRSELDRLKKQAWERGRYAQVRAEEVGRPYNEGDGF
ncbi:hypothetical protein AAFC00_001353 [Neodothiora populina]|uniref:Uncharacterized protein n=1 Tax=Neodothiora populina TaxID=2781224 RepID=A0ABR3PNL1_9PEZI